MTVLILKCRYSFLLGIPCLKTTQAATAEVPWMLELSKHSMWMGLFFNPSASCNAKVTWFLGGLVGLISVLSCYMISSWMFLSDHSTILAFGPILGKIKR